MKPVKAAAPSKIAEKTKSDKKETELRTRSKDIKKDNKVAEKSKAITRSKK